MPIVIYTGDQKWIHTKHVQKTQISNYVLEKYKINLELNFIDINKLPKKILIKRNSMLAYIMLMEKAKNRKELIENLLPLTTKEEHIKDLVGKMEHLLEDVLEEKMQQESLEEKQREEGKKDMSTLFDRLVKEGRMDIQRGKEASKRKIAKNMLNKKIEEETILEITEIEKEELEKIKKIK